jgi:acetyltransferase-like isoleucine patch superfamily enzyme
MIGQFCVIAPDVRLGPGVRIFNFVNLYGCEIAEGSKIGSFVEIQKNASIGKNCKVSSHTFICEGVTIEDDVFIGHGVNFINDKYPRATTATGALQSEADWAVERTIVGRGFHHRRRVGRDARRTGRRDRGGQSRATDQDCGGGDGSRVVPAELTAGTLADLFHGCRRHSGRTAGSETLTRWQARCSAAKWWPTA